MSNIEDRLHAVAVEIQSIAGAYRSDEAERDRLRTAVDAAQGAMVRHMVDCHDDECVKCATFGEVYPHLDPPALDGTGDMGGTDD